jgi:hypothetical protein
MPFKQLWFWESGKLNNRWAEVHAFSTEEFERPSTVVSKDKPTSAESVWYGSLDSENNLFINWKDEDIIGITPPLWYVVKDAPRPHPNGPAIPMMFIYALFGDDFPSGTIVMESDLINKKFLGRSQRVGFLQWFKQDSKIQQIFVEEKWRRKRITLALFGVADLVIVSGGYGQFLNGGDVTTNDGESLRDAWAGSKRVAPRIGSVEN